MTQPPQRIRVAYIVSSLMSGGAELQMLALSERLPRDEFHVDFICMAEPGPLAPRALATGARVFSLGRRPLGGQSVVSAALHRIRKIARFVRLLRAGRYDVVDAWMYPANDLAAISRWLTGVGVVIAGRRNTGPIQARYGAVEHALHAVVRRWSDLTVANSVMAAVRAIDEEHLDPRRVRVIRNGVIDVPPMPSDQRRALRSAWGADTDAIVIGCVANLRAVKGHRLLVEAFAELVERQPRARLVLVGDGPDRARIENMVISLGIAGRVTFHGRDDEVRHIYSAFDIVTLTSASEGLPNVLLEAGAAGLPVVATDVGGVSEVIVPDVTGLLVPPGDRSALITALERLVTDAGLRARMGLAARSHVIATFGMKRFVEEVAAMYRSAIGRAVL